MVGGVSSSRTASRPRFSAAAAGRQRRLRRSHGSQRAAGRDLASRRPCMRVTIPKMSSPESAEFVEVVFRVEPNYAGWRLDRYLCEKIRRLSRTRVQQIIKK